MAKLLGFFYISNMKKLLLLLLCLPMIGFGQFPVSGTLKAFTGIFNQRVQQPITDLATAIEAHYNKGVELNIPPTPFKDLTNIVAITEDFKGYTLTLRTISGIMVWQTENINAETILPKGKLKHAMYIVELKSKKEKQLKNILIK